MGFQRFERRLERLVEGTFTKAFRSGLQPVEIGRRLVREMETRRTLGVRGTVVPNEFAVLISAADEERFASFHDALVRELEETARDYARDEHYQFLGPVSCTVTADPRAKLGDLVIRASIVQGAGGLTGSLLLSDGRRVRLGEEVAVIGRLPDCAVALSDPQVSRHHAEIRRDDHGYRLVDMGSTNGTEVNGVIVRDYALSDGDVIVIGSSTIRYEES